MRFIKAVVLSLCFVVVSQAQQVYLCPDCGQYHQTQAPTPAQAPAITAPVAAMPGQAVAQARADAMARRGRLSHRIGGAPSWQSVPGAGFEGIGMSSRGRGQRSIPTCRPSGPSGAADDNSRQLLGDGYACNGRSCYRVRIWGGGGSGGYNQNSAGRRVFRGRLFSRLRRNR